MASPSEQLPTAVETPLSVSQLNRAARSLLEDNFPAVLVEGEISNCAMPSSGHWYLTLKDAGAQLRCAMFRNRNILVRFRPKDGMHVLVRGRLSLYEGRGDYQLILERMEELGDGALRRAFEALKERLFREGLFDEAHKRDIPTLPRHIGVITSATGAALRDVLSVLHRRFPLIRVTVLPVLVQGAAAAGEITRALQLANRRQGCLADLDVLVLARGGGSLEDLWCFNDEALARAIHASELPVVSAVGHEIDFTIADFVADLRAPTPSAAAELLSPDQLDYFALLAGFRQRLSSCMRTRLQKERHGLLGLTRRLRHPGRRLQEQAQRLDELEGRLRRAWTNLRYRDGARLTQLRAALRRHSPQGLIGQRRRELAGLRLRLGLAVQSLLRHKRQTLAAQGQALHTVSPLNTLARGYSISSDAEGRVLREAAAVQPGTRLVTRLRKGRLFSTVDAVEPGGED